MSKENYEAKLPLLEALPSEEVRVPDLPVDVYLQEAENLSVIASEDKEALTAVGLDWETYGEDLPVRAGALRHAQSQWVKTRYSQEEARKEWNRLSPLAYEERNDLLATFRFAFRRRADLLGRVSEITDGTGHHDMVQDLSDLAALGEAGTQELEAIHFDVTRLTQAAEQADQMAALLAQANGERFDDSAAKVLRDRAYTHLKAAVDEVRVTGRYIFRKDGRARAYASNYWR
ncbi:hypothetical protein FNH22_16155 [Fulvivirga sp. M361]|uniref:hypothetical protein n=1 Tax=Fulvivirga sp. M361 TaxID=2594266 RepID=UPI00117B9BC4|nr:hypothetical protein [Fulvivirga sp. M361]TRX56173.1 hypothetical protein FNH22_16155 [Fulvivirga sp. M361]